MNDKHTDPAPNPGFDPRELKPENAKTGLPGEQRSYTATTEGGPVHADGEEGAAHAKPADAPLQPEEKPDQLADKQQQAEDRQEALIDEGVEETFPASDPVSVKRIT